MAKYALRIKARQFRRKGKSIKWIAKHLEVSSGSVSLWCRDITLTSEQIENIKIAQIISGYAGRMKGAAMHKQKRLDTIQHYQIAGCKDIGRLSKRDLFLLGLGLYAGEGYKYGNRAGIANSDPAIIRLMMRWFREICGVRENEFACEVGINQLHKDRVRSVERYWSECTRVPAINFMKTSLKKVTNKKVYENKESHFGVLAIRIRKSANLEYKILGWLHNALV